MNQEWAPETINNHTFLQKFLHGFGHWFEVIQSKTLLHSSLLRRKMVRKNFLGKPVLFQWLLFQVHCHPTSHWWSPNCKWWLSFLSSGSCGPDQASLACAVASGTWFHFQHMIPVYVGAGEWEKGPRTNHSAVKDLGWNMGENHKIG